MVAAPGQVKAFGIAMVACGMAIATPAGEAQAKPLPASRRPATASCAPAPTSDFAVNVKDPLFGATGDGVTNDTSAIQRAVNAVGGSGGTVVIPAGTYLVDPVANAFAGIRLRHDMTLRFEPGAIFKALPTSTSNHVVLLVAGARNVNILGGTILGNRYNNSIRDTREGGLGVKVANSRNVVIEGLTAKDCWEDGFYVGESSRDVVLCGVVADGNRRHGLSITSVDGLLVKDCTFRNTTGFMENGGFACGNGTDIEPNAGQTVANVQFRGCTFKANATEGLAIGPSVSNRGRAFVANILVEGNFILDNGLHHGPSGITLSNTSGHRIINNTVSGNMGIGISLRNEANDNLVQGNTVTRGRAAASPGEGGIGILLYKSSGNEVTRNTVTYHPACGIKDADPTGVNRIGANTLRGNHPDACP